MDISLPTFIVAPDATGRGYALSASTKLSGRWTVDLPMLMLAWSQKKIDRPFACTFNSGEEGLIVCRGQFLRQLASGNTVAALAGVLLTNEQFDEIGWRTDLLATTIPLPDDRTEFSKEPHIYALSKRSDAIHPWQAFNLGWGRRFIMHDRTSDPLFVVSNFFESITPETQRSWFRCWSTTDTLPAKGSLDVLEQAQLILGLSLEKASKEFRTAEFREPKKRAGIRNQDLSNVEPTEIPDSYQVYRQIEIIFQKVVPESKLEVFPKWTANLAHMNAGVLAKKLALKIVGSVKKSQAYELLSEMLSQKSDAIREAGEVITIKIVERLAARRTLDAKIIPLVRHLRDKDGLAGALVKDGNLDKLNTRVLIDVAESVAADLAMKAASSPKSSPNITMFAIEIASLAKQGLIPIDSAENLVHSLSKGTEIVGEGVEDVLIGGGVQVLSGAGDADGMVRATQILMDDHFFQLSEFRSVPHATARMAAACAAIEYLAG